jgi:hypothetical protein
LLLCHFSVALRDLIVTKVVLLPKVLFFVPFLSLFFFSSSFLLSFFGGPTTGAKELGRGIKNIHPFKRAQQICARCRKHAHSVKCKSNRFETSKTYPFRNTREIGSGYREHTHFVQCKRNQVQPSGTCTYWQVQQKPVQILGT